MARNIMVQYASDGDSEAANKIKLLLETKGYPVLLNQTSSLPVYDGSYDTLVTVGGQYANGAYATLMNQGLVKEITYADNGKIFYQHTQYGGWDIYCAAGWSQKDSNNSGDKLVADFQTISGIELYRTEVLLYELIPGAFSNIPLVLPTIFYNVGALIVAQGGTLITVDVVGNTMNIYYTKPAGATGLAIISLSAILGVVAAILITISVYFIYGITVNLTKGASIAADLVKLKEEAIQEQWDLYNQGIIDANTRDENITKINEQYDDMINEANEEQNYINQLFQPIIDMITLMILAVGGLVAISVIAPLIKGIIPKRD